MIDKKVARKRRSKKLRAGVKRENKVRLSVYRTIQHIYAQIIAPDGQVLAAFSTLSQSLRTTLKNTGNKEAAMAVGKGIAEAAKKAGVTEVVFDRSGFKYHGRLKALAEAAREAGLQF